MASTEALGGHAGTLMALDSLGKQPRQSLYRPAQPMTYELTNHSKAYLEGRQYVGGFALLDALLSAGTSISTPAKPYVAYLPPASQLALASTLVVYPSITTKASSYEGPKGSDAALAYLHSVHNIISPLHEDLAAAYSFPHEQPRRRAGAHSLGIECPVPETNINDESLRGPAANSQSLWNRATDFWHIVGWAFNCSVLHKRRWERWRLWLQLTVNYLETEWLERLKASKLEGADEDAVLMESLIWRYISHDDPTNRANRRRMVKAILAMATAQSKSLYKEIWDDEAAAPKQQEGDGETLTKVDIENDHFGDYGGDEDEEMMEDATGPSRSARRTTARRTARFRQDDELEPKNEDDDNPIKDMESAVERLGGLDAIRLRQRLIALLARVAQALPLRFTKLNDLLDSFTEEFVHLPTIIFGLLLSTSALAGQGQIALNANLLLPLLSGKLPDYTVIEPEQSHLESILPMRAATNSQATNAKITLILEQIFMYMMDQNLLKPTDTLRRAVEDGIVARCSVYGIARGRKGEEEQAKGIMENSSERLQGLLDVLEISTGMDPPRRMESELSFATTSSLSSPPCSSTEEEII
ncbi:hypothetical protein EJ04DRAFT_574942 [Polyplosphaeria fusca]|uniref:Uncharacterized protein n=1 Tax=Polyplosphaeria fusca TaxID=682080 RepID=A0A9P4R616_9PLEO|nr:hypothetical protein EJ04DRAFT_574942 [Polyplosphaeria fusca]